MTPANTRLFFAERIDISAFVTHSTGLLFARVTDRERLDLRWKSDGGTVWVRDARVALAGRFTVPAGVAERLGGGPASALSFGVDEQPESGYLAFLVVTALLGRWRGCVLAAGDPTILASKDMPSPASVERLLTVLCERGSHDD